MPQKHTQEKVIVIFVSCPDIISAEKIAHALIEKRLAACVNILHGMHSIYRWEGKIENSKELLLLIKSKQSLFQDLEEEILKIHPYDTTEILALESSAATEKYKNWLFKETI